MRDGPDLRVVLLGRTGLDAALRLDPSIELVRASDPLQAIGELTHAAGESGPGHAAVVIAKAVPGLVESDPADVPRLTQFISALRLARPGVAIFGMANGQPPHADLDGTLLANAPPEALRRMVRLPSQAAKPAAQGPVMPDASSKAESFDEDSLIAAMIASNTITPRHTDTAPAPLPEPPTPAAIGDLDLVAALLRGVDPLALALDTIRKRTNDPGVQFHGGPDAAARGGVAVAWEGATFGHLAGTRATPDALRPHAAWLGAWLRARDQHDQLRAAAFTDALTGAWNRRYFDRFLASAIERARAARRTLSVLLFDIDDFKVYNDRYGHDAGDDILRETVLLLRSVIRPTDRVCRVGGDEFAVVFDEPEGPRQEGSRQPTDVFAIARRFQEQILRHRFPKLLECAPGTLTISGGLATFPWDGTSPDELLRRADQLAMASKKQGKNAITMGPGAIGLVEE